LQTLSPQEAQARLPELQSQLASRQSTAYFARTAIALVASAVFSAAAAKLFWDSIRFPVLGATSILLAVGLVAYAWGQYRRARAHLQTELRLFASLKDVHRALQLDDPAALLPR
jgi:predicted Na+-dependent transporter